MSLFSAKTWWSTNVEAPNPVSTAAPNAPPSIAGVQCPTFGCRHIAAIAQKASDDQATSDLVFVASYSGYLQCFRPQGGRQSQPTDLLLQFVFDKPILQIFSIAYLQNQANRQLGVLQANKLTIYHVTFENESVSLKALHSFAFPPPGHTAHSCAIGPFSSIKGCDGVCVQMREGSIWLIEQTEVAVLPPPARFIMPLPLCISPSAESLVLFTSEWNVCSYRLASFSHVRRGIGESSAQDKSSANRRWPAPGWIFPLGERLLQLSDIAFPNAPGSILALGEHTIFYLSEKGMLRFVKRLDYSPLMAYPYPAIRDNHVMLMVIFFRQKCENSRNAPTY